MIVGYSKERAERTAEEWVALPGTSEHQIGIAVDINGIHREKWILQGQVMNRGTLDMLAQSTHK